MRVGWDCITQRVTSPDDKPASAPAANFSIDGEGYTGAFDNDGCLRADDLARLGMYGNRHARFEIWLVLATAGVEQPPVDPPPGGGMKEDFLAWSAANQLVSLKSKSARETAAAKDGFYPIGNGGRISWEDVRYAIREFEKPQSYEIQHRPYYAPVTDYTDAKWLERK